MISRNARFNLAALAVALLLGGGIALVVSVMTSPTATPLVSCTGQDACTNGPRPTHQQLDPLAPTAPPRRDDARQVP